METSLVTCRTLDDFYHVDRRTFEKQYKEILSGYREWRDLGHADKWLVFPENIGPNVAIDESSLSNGELYTFVTNRDRHCGEGCLIAIVEGTKSEDVAEVLERIDESKRESVTEITLDLSDSMRRIVSRAFPKARRVIDRFHIQKLACEAVQEMRIRHRWDAIQKCNDEMEEAKLEGRDYVPERFPNGDTRKELLARSRYLLFKDGGKWTESQKERAEILFSEYPDLRKAYGLSHSLRMIFARNTIKGYLFHLSHFLIVDITFHAPSPHTSHHRIMSETGIRGDVPTSLLDLGHPFQFGIQPTSEMGIDNREESFPIRHLQCQHQSFLIRIRLHILRHLHIAGGRHHCDIPSVFTVERIHHATKYDTMRRCVFQSRISDGIMYHFVKHHILELPFTLIIIIADVNRIIIILDSAHLQPSLACHGTESRTRFGQCKTRAR
jgi:hypothetical protein